MTETISWGILYYAFTVYLAPMGLELGWSSGDMTGAFSLGLLLSGLAAIPVGRWLDRHGPRLAMTLGSVVASLLVVAWSMVTNLAQLYVIFAAIGLTMAVTLYDPAFATATRWFERSRLRALTVITLMAGFASTIFIPLAQWLVERQGWRGSLLTLAAILAVGTIAPHAIFLKRRPEDMGLAPDGGPLTTPPAHGHTPRRPHLNVGQAIREPSFRWVVTAFWLNTLASIALGVHLVPYLGDRGYDPGFAAVATGLVGAMQVVARLVMAPFGERASPRILAAATLALQPMAFMVLLLARSTAGIYAFVVLFGAARGASTLTRPTLLVDLYGRAQFATIAGVLQFALSIAQSIAPVGAGVAYDAFGSYDPVFGVLTVLSAVAVVAVLPARRRPRQYSHSRE